MEEYEKNGEFTSLIGSPVVYIHEINSIPRFENVVERMFTILKYDRVIAISKPKDVVFLKFQPDKGYLKWLEEVGLGTKNIIILNCEQKEKMPDIIPTRKDLKEKVHSFLGEDKKIAVISPFIGKSSEEKVSKFLEIPLYSNKEKVEKFDSKINFKNICRKVGVPVVEDVEFQASEGIERLRSIVEDMLKETGIVIIRGEFGATASTTNILEKVDDEELKEIIESGEPEDRYIIEPFKKPLYSPSSVWFITKEKRIVHIRTSNQLLEDYISHDGNEFPGPYNEELIDEYSFRIAKEFAKEGYVGPFGFDFIETKEGVYGTECNPRMTGSLYPWALVSILERHGKINAARSKNIALKKKGKTFSELREILGELLYNGKKNSGVVVPYNLGPLPYGKISVLVTGSSIEEVDSIYEELFKRLDKL